MSLDKSLKYLEELNKKELEKKLNFSKKSKHKNTKQDVIVETKVDRNLSMFLKSKKQFEYKNKMRLKSLRLKKEITISDDFNEKYKKSVENIYNKEWKSLTRSLKLNRVCKYMKLKKIELNWTNEEYYQNLELIKYTGLNKNIEYDITSCKITHCSLFDVLKE